MSHSLALYRAANGTLLDDLSSRARAASFATNEHGFAESRVSVDTPLIDAFRLYNRPGLPELALYSGASVIHEGRLEDVAITTKGLDLTAFGYQNAFRDAPYTALWSDTTVGGWTVLTPEQYASGSGRKPSRYSFDTNKRLFIAPQKNAAFGTATDEGSLQYLAPSNGTRTIIGVSFDYAMVAYAGLQIYLETYTDGTLVATPWAPAIPAALTLYTGAVNVTCAACNRLVFTARNNSGGVVTYANETGDIYLKVTNLRIVTSTTNRVNTTLTVARAAGVNVTATVGSTARMYVGQQLQINQGVNNASETVTVLSIGGSTQFNATFVNAYAIGDAVQAHVVYSDDIAKDLVTTVAALNSTQISSSTALIQSPGIDLLNEVYEDRAMADILDYLIGLGDSQTPPRQWEWGVWEDRRLHFRPRGTNARTWYVDASEIELERTLSQLHNSIYATYQEAGGRTLRSAATADTASVARYGLTRRKQINVQSTSAAQAATQQAAALSDDKDPIPRAGLTFESVYDAQGARWPLWYVRSGDTIVIRNLQPTLSTAIDRIRTFRIVRTTYDVVANTIQVEPESPLPTLTTLLAREPLGGE